MYFSLRSPLTQKRFRLENAIAVLLFLNGAIIVLLSLNSAIAVLFFLMPRIVCYDLD